MRVARSLDEAAQFGPTAVAIGNFDGVHIAHRELLSAVLRASRQHALAPSILTFDPHPASVVAPHRQPRLLSTLAERCSLLAREGIENVLILPFTVAVSRWTPMDFAERVLDKAFHAKVVVVGDNFKFGHRQAGDTGVLAELGAHFGFETHVVNAFVLRGQLVSSSEIRKAIETGRIGLAGRMLGRPYSVAGEVVPGQGIGSKQTVPTLNLRTPAQVIPATGVYITRTTEADNESLPWESITNVGYRPTFQGVAGTESLTIETYLLSPFTPPAPARIRVEFLRRLRDERKFESAEALKMQIMRDAGRARVFFRRLAGLVAERAESLQ
ncbi:MAG TPA: bifunctional riboflavin kinase/FAD synthetase [Bryobacteraceae bacterium]|nr:bifunctional riboflavin kinase/FAD synthetase [Bryobacteraceae bacterium]